MVKKSNPKRRGLRKGVQSHKIAAKKVTQEVSWLVKALNSLGINSGQVSLAAKICRQYTITACTGLCLVPFQLSAGGRYEYAPLWKRIIHYFVLSFYGCVMVYKLVVTMQLLIFEELSAATFLCGVTFLIFVFSAISALGTSWNKMEITDLMNSWEPLGRSMSSSAGKKFEVLSSLSVCLKLMAITWLVLCGALNAAALSLVFEDLPVCMLPMINNLGIIPENYLPTFWWQIAFVPMEVLTLLPPMLVTGLNMHTLVIGVAVLQYYADELRKIDLADFQSWIKVVHLYKCMALYNGMFTNWHRLLSAPILFAVGSGVTILLYVTFRPSGLPMIVYCWFPLVAVGLIIVVTWLLYDAVSAKRSADQVLGNIQSRTSGCYQNLQRAAKPEFIRRARALQPIGLAISEFTEVSLDVAVAIWEEVFNQFLFLLSL